MRKLIFYILSIFTISITNAQSFGTVYNSNVGGTIGSGAAISHLVGDISSADAKTNIAFRDVQGSAYTTDNFLYGTVLYKDEVESTVYYRYNAYMEEIEVKKVDVPGADVQSLNRDKNILVKNIQGQTISFRTFIDKKKLTQNGYLTLLSDGEYKLYKRVDVKYTEGQKAQNSFVKAIPPRFTQFTEYYFQKEGVNRIDELVTKNAKLLKLLDDDSKAKTKAFLKEGGLNIKKETDLIKIFEFLNKK